MLCQLWIAHKWNKNATAKFSQRIFFATNTQKHHKVKNVQIFLHESCNSFVYYFLFGHHVASHSSAIVRKDKKLLLLL